MPMYNLIEHSDNSSKISGILWQYCRYNGKIVNFTTDEIKEKKTGKRGNNGTKNVEIMVPLQYLSNFWRTPEIPLINCEINLDLNWYEKCVIVLTDIVDQGATFSITDTKILSSSCNFINSK